MTFSVLGTELEMDIYDVDVYECYQDAVNDVSYKVNDAPEGKDLSTADSMRYQCAAVKEFFDIVFGAGTADTLFHGKNNIRDVTEAYLTVIKAVSEEMTSYTELMNDEFSNVNKKYAPEEDYAGVQNLATSSHNLNRAQRRNSRKKHR